MTDCGLVRLWLFQNKVLFLLKIGLIYVKIEWSTSIKAATCLGDGLTVVGIVWVVSLLSHLAALIQGEM